MLDRILDVASRIDRLLWGPWTIVFIMSKRPSIMIYRQKNSKSKRTYQKRRSERMKGDKS
jgi:hypothetical protein